MKTTNKNKILLVEDEISLVKIMSQRLMNEGFLVTIATDGESAMKFLKKTKFDLLILDLILPKIDGFEVLKQMKDKKIQVSTIVVSNLSQQEIEKKAMNFGVKDFLVKSDITLDEIVNRVKSFL